MKVVLRSNLIIDHLDNNGNNHHQEKENTNSNVDICERSFVSLYTLILRIGTHNACTACRVAIQLILIAIQRVDLMSKSKRPVSFFFPLFWKLLVVRQKLSKSSVFFLRTKVLAMWMVLFVICRLSMSS